MKKIFILAIFALFCFHSQPLAQMDVVQVEGQAPLLDGDPARARQQAISNALRQAVEQRVGVLLTSTTLAENYAIVSDKILTRTSGYITSYDVLRESTTDDAFHVLIEARVGRENLIDDLRAIGLLHVMAEKPRVLVVYDEVFDDSLASQGPLPRGLATQTIITELIAAEFNVVDPQIVKAGLAREQALQILAGDAQAAAAAGLRYDAQMVIFGNAQVSSAGRFQNTRLQSFQVDCQAHVVRTDDPKIIASISEHEVAAHVDVMQGSRQVIQAAGKNLTTALIREIVSQWSRETYGQTREITLVFSHLDSFARLVEIRRYLENHLPGAQAVHQRSFGGGSAELLLDYAGQSTALAEALMLHTFAGFALDPVSVTPSRVDLKMLPEP